MKDVKVINENGVALFTNQRDSGVTQDGWDIVSDGSDLSEREQTVCSLLNVETSCV